MKRIFKHGRTKPAYDDLSDQIYDIDKSEELCTFTQCDQEGNRRVLWNFDNVDGIGTIGFRGGPGLQSKSETIRWILFAVNFILLAIEEVRDLGLGRMLHWGEIALMTRL